MDTILCLDTSASMQGTRLQELKRAVNIFINFAKKSRLGERISMVEFGGSAFLKNSFSTNYGRLNQSVNSIASGGTTPMAKGLIQAFNEMVTNGKVTIIANRLELKPRIILMTDGQPDSAEDVRKVVLQFAALRIPIACVGVDGCDQNLLNWIANTTGGIFTMANNIEALSAFFYKQVMITLFISQHARNFKKLYSIQSLRLFMHQKTGRNLSEPELKALLGFIQNITKSKGSKSTRTKKKGSILSASKFIFSICLMLNSILSAEIFIKYFFDLNNSLSWIEHGLLPQSSKLMGSRIWLIGVMFLVTYFFSKWVYRTTRKLWGTPLLKWEKIWGLLLSLGLFGILSIILFGWISWPLGIGYSLIGTIGLLGKFHVGN